MYINLGMSQTTAHLCKISPTLPSPQEVPQVSYIYIIRPGIWFASLIVSYSGISSIIPHFILSHPTRLYIRHGVSFFIKHRQQLCRCYQGPTIDFAYLLCKLSRCKISDTCYMNWYDDSELHKHDYESYSQRTISLYWIIILTIDAGLVHWIR